MHYSLIVVGAHNGRKIQSLIREKATKGRVMLIEPVPWLFKQLEKNFESLNSVDFLNLVIAERAQDTVSFYAPIESANEVVPWGDQLGSLNSNFAIEVDAELSKKIETISSVALSFESLISQYDISSIDYLFTDTEGYDAKILATFPFSKIKPQKIFFEYKHSDGVFNIGKNLAKVLVILSDYQYKIKIVDVENCEATLSAN